MDHFSYLDIKLFIHSLIQTPKFVLDSPSFIFHLHLQFIFLHGEKFLYWFKPLFNFKIHWCQLAMI